MKTEGGNGLSDVMDLMAGRQKAAKPIPIKIKMHGTVEIGIFSQKISGNERAGLVPKIVYLPDRYKIFNGGVALPQPRSDALAVDEVDNVPEKNFMGMLSIGLSDYIEGIRQQKVIAIDPNDKVARSPLKTLIDRVRLASIRFAGPVGQVSAILLNDFNASIRTSTIDDDVFKIRIILGQDGMNCSVEVSRLVQGWSHYRNTWTSLSRR